MTTPDEISDLHHDLRSALSAVVMSLETLEGLEAGSDGKGAKKRQRIVARAKETIQEATRLADRLRNALEAAIAAAGEGRPSQPGGG